MANLDLTKAEQTFIKVMVETEAIRLSELLELAAEEMRQKYPKDLEKTAISHHLDSIATPVYQASF